LKLIIPINWSEKNIIITPAIILKISELVKKKIPINVAVEPKAIKTKEKPKVKKIVLITIKFFFFQLAFLMMFLKYKKCIRVLMVERMAIKS